MYHCFAQTIRYFGITGLRPVIYAAVLLELWLAWKSSSQRMECLHHTEITEWKETNW